MKSQSASVDFIDVYGFGSRIFGKHITKSGRNELGNSYGQSLWRKNQKSIKRKESRDVAEDVKSRREMCEEEDPFHMDLTKTIHHRRVLTEKYANAYLLLFIAVNFCLALPVVFLVALLAMVVEYKGFAFQLVNLYQRFMPSDAAEIGNFNVLSCWNY